MITQEGRTSSRLGREAERGLENLLQQFDLWAASADQSDDGWESDFPQWPELIRDAERAMAGEAQSEHVLSLIGRCWSLSHEDETCADWARRQVQDVRVQELVRRLADDDDATTRWQACDVLGDQAVLDDVTRVALEKGMTDENAYVRRRAFLSLLRHREGDVQPYVLRMLADASSYNRYVGVKVVTNDSATLLRDQAQAAAQDPDVASLLAHYISHKETIDRFDK